MSIMAISLIGLPPGSRSQSKTGQFSVDPLVSRVSLSGRVAATCMLEFLNCRYGNSTVMKMFSQNPKGVSHL